MKEYLTPDFYATLFLHVLTLVAFVVTAFGHSFDGTALQSIIPAAAFLASAIAQAMYNHGAAKVKMAKALGTIIK